jgi:hypothetical protein
MILNTACAEVDLFLRVDMKDLRPFLLNRFLFFKDIKIKRKEQINHPGREMNLVKIRKSIVPATPPSKGGETF